jgi:5-methylcytosine-specific restriction endonuclease McrA
MIAAPVNYREYLASADWQVKRADAIERAGYRCEVCGLPWGLEVHHKTYERLGNELPEDLACLCWGCHRGLHRADYA